tara:strand:+ start:5130 stop:5339 length:210 start_codon:yes stop_codon:yes gene_type:complete
MTVTTSDRGQQNVFAKEPTMYITEEDMEQYQQQTYAERAELANSHWAMLGVVAGLISYALTGNLFFGLY